MQTLAAGILALACVVGGILVPDAAGTWSLEMQWPGGASTGTCSFTQDRDRLSGTCGSEEGRFPITGVVKGLTIALLIEVAQDGGQTRLELDGDFDERFTAIKGNCLVGDQLGTFTMTKK